MDGENVIKGLELLRTRLLDVAMQDGIVMLDVSIVANAIELLKVQENEYEHGFNDAMIGKQELMYEGTDGKWHKKDW